MTPQNSTYTSLKTYDIEGQEVTCYENDGHRLWVCKCDDFKRKLSRHGEGFCPHTAVAIMLFIQGGGAISFPAD